MTRPQGGEGAQNGTSPNVTTAPSAGGSLADLFMALSGGKAGGTTEAAPKPSHKDNDPNFAGAVGFRACSARSESDAASDAGSGDGAIDACDERFQRGSIPFPTPKPSARDRLFLLLFVPSQRSRNSKLSWSMMRPGEGGLRAVSR